MKYSDSVCLLGAGNVATHLGRALQAANYPILGIFSRMAEHADRLAEELDCPIPTPHLEELPDAEIVIISVKDDAIPDVAYGWAKSHPQSHALLVHTAGSVPLKAVADVSEKAAVLYPMQTFSWTRPIDFQKVPIFVEGSNDEALLAVTKLAHNLSALVTPLDTARRRILHLSAVFACNFPNHCYALAYGLLRQAGIPPESLLPLIDETAAKLHELNPEEAQTGPAVRWDESVMQKHLLLLDGQPQMQAIYKMLSTSIHQLQESAAPL